MTVPTEMTELLATDVGRRAGDVVGAGSKSADSLARLVEQLLVPGAIRMDAQPIVGLADGTILGFELLARSTMPCSSGPDQWLQQASDLGIRTEFELACLQAAADRGRAPGRRTALRQSEPTHRPRPTGGRHLGSPAAQGDRDHRARAGARLPAPAAPPSGLAGGHDDARHRRRRSRVLQHVARSPAPSPLHQDRSEPGPPSPSGSQQVGRVARIGRVRPAMRCHDAGRGGRDERGAQRAPFGGRRSRAGVPPGSSGRGMARATPLAHPPRVVGNDGLRVVRLHGLPAREGGEDGRSPRRRGRGHGPPLRELRLSPERLRRTGRGAAVPLRTRAVAGARWH